jgi:hypothetical protein
MTNLEQAVPAATKTVAAPISPTDRAARIKLVLMFLLFAAPVVASYVSYYLIQPQGRTNYGELVLPQLPIGNLPFARLDVAGKPVAEAVGFKGKWLMLTALTGSERQSLERRLYLMRQVRLTTGKDMERIERALVLLDDALAPAALIGQHHGLHVLRLPPADWRTTFSAGSDRIYLVDPLGNLMMSFPFDPDPNKMKKDLAKLLRASRIG